MPYVNVKVAGELSNDQRRQIIEGVTELMQKVANKPPAATYVVIDEVPRSHWAKNGKLLSES